MKFYNNLKKSTLTKYNKTKRFLLSKYYLYKYNSEDFGYVQFLQTNLKSLIGSPNNAQPKLDAKITIAICEALWQYKDLLGMQPMNGPVGISYKLRYKQKEDNRLTIEIISQTVEARSRKLQTIWTMEAIQDAQAVHNIDITNELVKATVDNVVNEILNMYFNRAIELASTKLELTTQDPDNRSLHSIESTLYQASSILAQRTRRGCGNNIYVPSKYVELIKSLPNFKPLPGKELIGKLNTMNVYSLPINIDKILIAYQGSSATDTGLMYCPYHVYMPKFVVDSSTFSPLISLMTRYGLCEDEKSGDYFATIDLISQ